VSRLVEPLLHFVVPFVSFKAFGVDLRKAALASLAALTPDADVLFHIHRSQSHSIIVLGVILVPLLVVTRNRKGARTLVLLCGLGVLSHLVMDLFQSPTPLLWPLLNESLIVAGGLNIRIGSVSTVTATGGLVTGQSAIGYFSSFDAPLVTTEGVGISIVLITPMIVSTLLNTDLFDKKGVDERVG
jgi:membrane-bound metal-dependent hydrolase YbcI (DUF457 family)